MVVLSGDDGQNGRVEHEIGQLDVAAHQARQIDVALDALDAQARRRVSRADRDGSQGQPWLRQQVSLDRTLDFDYRAEVFGQA